VCVRIACVRIEYASLYMQTNSTTVCLTNAGEGCAWEWARKSARAGLRGRWSGHLCVCVCVCVCVCFCVGMGASVLTRAWV